MANEAFDPVTGERFIERDGEWVPAPEVSALESLMIQYHDQVRDYGRFVGNLAGIDVDESTREAQRYMDTLRADRPITGLVGEALPGAVAGSYAALRGAAGLVPQVAIGAAEQGADYDPDVGGGWRAGFGAVGTLAGEIAGRVLGRGLNTLMGWGLDVTRARPPAANPAAARLGLRGYDTLGYERLEPDTPGQRYAQRWAQSAEAGSFATPQMQRVAQARNNRFKQTVLRALGMPGDAHDRLNTEFIADATNQLNERYTAMQARMAARGQVDLRPDVAGRLEGLEDVQRLVREGAIEPVNIVRNADGEIVEASIRGEDIMAIREGLEGYAARMDAQNPRVGRAVRENLVDAYDSAVGDSELMSDYARLREQNRVFRFLQQSGNISRGGDIRIPTMHNRALSQWNTQYTGGRDVTNPETRDFLDDLRALAPEDFDALRSSMTTERGQGLEEAADLAQALATGDPGLASRVAGRAVMPAIVGASNVGGGRMFQGMATPAPRPMGLGGGFLGREVLDDYLYPFVGSEDDRQVPFR